MKECMSIAFNFQLLVILDDTTVMQCRNKRQDVWSLTEVGVRSTSLVLVPTGPASRWLRSFIFYLRLFCILYPDSRCEAVTCCHV